MNTTIIPLQEIKLVGIATKTSNNLEQNPTSAQIGITIQKFFGYNMQAQILSRKHPGKVFAVYTEYESDENSPYTYFLGEEVNDFKNVTKEFKTLRIPPQSYAKFTSKSGEMPSVCINMWQNIWKMNSDELGGKRTYIADFEIYDERSQDPQNTVLDIYIGIKK